MSRSIPLIFSTIFLFSGCSTSNLRWQTVIHEDGSVTRTVSQPRSEKNELLQTEDWELLREHNQWDRDEWPGRLDESVLKETRPLAKNEEDERPYLLATGSFNSVEKIPEHYEYKLKTTDLRSRLEHSLNIYDYGLVKEYIWVEQITNVVKLEQLPTLRRETIQLIATILEEGLSSSLGPDYDISKLIAWIKTDGEQLLEEFTLLSLSREETQLSEEEYNRKLAAILSKYDWTEISDEGFDAFLRHRLKTGIVRKDKNPIEEKLLDAILKEPKTKDESMETDNPYYEAILNAYFKHSHDSERNVSRLETLLVQQLGIYHPLTIFLDLHKAKEFDIWAQLPGIILETNGVIADNNFVHWTFGDNNINHTGFLMTARSAVAVKKPELKFLKQGQLATRNQILEYMRLVTKDPELKQTAERCIEDNSLDPLQKRIQETHAKWKLNEDVNSEKELLAAWNRAKQLFEILNQSKQ